MLSEAQILKPGPNFTRAGLKNRFLDQRKIMEQLCRGLSDEDCMLSATTETSPPKWHLAHTTWFYEHFILAPHVKSYRVFDPSFEYLFNSYYRAIGEFLPKAQRALISRPSLERVLQYRSSVTRQVAELLSVLPLALTQKIESLVELGIHHEQQHQELLLMDIKRNFFDLPAKPAYLASPPPRERREGTSEPLRFRAYAGGLVEMGHAGETFHYDNESGKHRVFLEPFALSNRLVSNADYLIFIEAGGYDDPKYWLSDGWDTIQKEKWRAPLYWIIEGKTYSQMTLSGVRPLDLAEPVCHLSYYEAQAFASFQKARLPTEAEWEFAASFDPKREHFMEDGIYHPAPSTSFHGNLWEWTQSAYLPYPGYQAFDQGLSEYNSKFMCNQFVLRGGSVVTPLSHYRPSYRNFFYPHQRWQYSGFRLAKDIL